MLKTSVNQTFLQCNIPLNQIKRTLSWPTYRVFMSTLFFFYIQKHVKVGWPWRCSYFSSYIFLNFGENLSLDVLIKMVLIKKTECKLWTGSLLGYRANEPCTGTRRRGEEEEPVYSVFMPPIQQICPLLLTLASAFNNTLALKHKNVIANHCSFVTVKIIVKKTHMPQLPRERMESELTFIC